ncbi:hypothetical protein ACFOHK_02210 [Falsigemmobacter intermedius]|uniref:Lipoprotein n=1 Tax=Falsigemmobacter intermedius TaxID=1553448 RepID=A0A3S3V6F6_9RHOB|nr:hypothetical protein [Falsigemmobacter intermedius]RWY42495.1 hypothetical protein EP867_07120 [Falsigemmobacter intermedius]
MVRFVAGVLVALSLSGCAAERVWAPDEAVKAARYVHQGPPELMLVTSINDRSGEGAHTGLLINASERVLFDPAGNWDDPRAPERHDLRYGMTPQMQANYFAFQSAGPFHAVIQRVQVSPEVAERAYQLARDNGPVPSAFCTSATSKLLSQLPGFEGVQSTMFPKSLMESFATLPGVKTQIVYGSPDQNEPDRVPLVSPVIAKAIQGGN